MGRIEVILVHPGRPHRENVAVPPKGHTADPLPKRCLRIRGKRRCLDLTSDLFEDLGSNVGVARGRDELGQAGPETGYVEPVPVEVRC